MEKGGVEPPHSTVSGRRRSQARGDADGDELFGVAGGGTADAAGAVEPRAAQLLVGGFRDIGKVESAIGNIFHALCESSGAR